MKRKEIQGTWCIVVPHRHVLSCTVPSVTSNLNSAGHQSERSDLLVQLLEHHGEEQAAHQEFPVPRRREED